MRPAAPASHSTRAARKMRGTDERQAGYQRQTQARPSRRREPVMLRKLLLALSIALAAALPVRAQETGGFWSEPPDQLFDAALESPYAQALLKRFAAAVRKDGDQACLQAKALDDAALAARGQALLRRHGVQMAKLMDENFDRAAYLAALSASAGRNAAAEIERLKRDPGVKTFTALNRPAQLARTVDMVLEQFDRYVLVGRIKLDPIAPIARGEPDLPENPTQAAEAAVEKFLDQRPSPRVDRYLDLLDAAKVAKQKGFNVQSAAKLGPMAYFAGAERDLAELCVLRR
jgi:hypothetical protein